MSLPRSDAVAKDDSKKAVSLFMVTGQTQGLVHAR